MSWQEWRDTPWWVQRAYIEGMEHEELLEMQPVAPAGDWESDPLGADVREYTDMGLRVIRGTV